MGALAGINRRLHDRLRVQRIVLDGDVPKGGTPKQPLLFINPTEPPSASTAAIEGACYFDDDLHALVCHNGTGWVIVGGMGQVVAVTGGTLALTGLAESTTGTTYMLNKADGIAVTLPAIAAAQIGTRYRFICGVSVSGGSTTITAATGDLLTGSIIAQDTDSSNAVVAASPDGSDDLILTLNGGTQGGLIGSYFDFIATSATSWHVSGVTRHSSNYATNFS